MSTNLRDETFIGLSWLKTKPKQEQQSKVAKEAIRRGQNYSITVIKYRVPDEENDDQTLRIHAPTATRDERSDLIRTAKKRTFRGLEQYDISVLDINLNEEEHDWLSEYLDRLIRREMHPKDFSKVILNSCVEKIKYLLIIGKSPVNPIWPRFI